MKAPRAAFSLVEAVVALSITTIAASAVLLGITRSIDTMQTTVSRTIAEGLVNQLLDELSAARYHEPLSDPMSTALGPEGTEATGSGRRLFDDLDDYHGFRSKPPRDVWGIPLGSQDDAGGLRGYEYRAASDWLDDWEQEVQVYYVNEQQPGQRLPDGQTSRMRAAVVRIYSNPGNGAPRRLLAEGLRVFSHVPHDP